MSDETSEVTLAAIDAALRGMTGAEQVRLIATLRAELAGKARQIHRLQTGQDIEGDHVPEYVSNDEHMQALAELTELRAEVEALREAESEKHEAIKRMLATLAERDRTIAAERQLLGEYAVELGIDPADAARRVAALSEPKGPAQ